MGTYASEVVSEYICKTPVIFIFFNRPNTMKQVLEQIRRVKPEKLYLVADGPRSEEELDKVKECRCIVDKMIDWNCQVIKVYAEKNLGCRNRVSSGISFVLEREEKAIILEDDCVPNISFFRFMEEMLEFYKNDEDVYLVSGRNHFGKYDDKRYDYHFSNHISVWGWGTWARSWRLYDINMTYWPEIRRKKGGHLREWMGWKEWMCRRKSFDDTYKAKINTWDYQLELAMIFNRKISIVPSNNLIRNIGNGIDATHTMKEDNLINVPAYELTFPLRHPKTIVVNAKYDKLYSKMFIEKGALKNSIYRNIKEFLKILTGKEISKKDLLLFAKKLYAKSTTR